MSGGAFDYEQDAIDHIAERLERAIHGVERLRETGDGFSDETMAELRNALHARAVG